MHVCTDEDCVGQESIPWQRSANSRARTWCAERLCLRDDFRTVFRTGTVAKTHSQPPSFVLTLSGEDRQGEGDAAGEEDSVRTGGR